jgi:hypothetical protein
VKEVAKRAYAVMRECMARARKTIQKMHRTAKLEISTDELWVQSPVRLFVSGAGEPPVLCWTT